MYPTLSLYFIVFYMHWLLFSISNLSTECECNRVGTVNSTHEITGNSTCQCKGGFSGETCHDLEDFHLLLEDLTGRRDFVVTCNGPCKDVDIEIKEDGDGDADLFASTVLPVLKTFFNVCDLNTCFCVSVNFGAPDFCNDINLSDSDRFIFTVNARTGSPNVNLTVAGKNLAGVLEIKS